MERYRRILFLLLAVAVAIPIVVRSRPGRDHTARAVFSLPTAPAGYVQISGDVRHPGIYPLGVKSMTVDVISMASPVRPVTPPVARAVDGMPAVSGDSYHVALKPDGSAVVSRGSIPAAQRIVLGIPLDIDLLSESDLDRLPGISPELARRIVAHRHKNGGHLSVQDLQMVEGIGEKRFDALRKYFQHADIR